MSELVNIYSKYMNNETILFQWNYLESILFYICKEIQFHLFRFLCTIVSRYITG